MTVGNARSTLLEPVALGALPLANRVVMAPMTRCRALAGGVPHESAPLYYAQRASAGLIVSEGTCISPTATGNQDVPGIWSDQQIEAWRRVTGAVHDAGGLIVAQLWHIGRAAIPTLLPEGVEPVGPSAIPIDPTTYLARRVVAYATPRALDVAEIAEIVRDYARAAENAREAGFDGVELHGANGYLIDQFLHASSNQRDDVYGGSPWARSRFLSEVAEAVCEAWDPRRVGVRLSPTSSFQDMHDPDPAGLFAVAIERLAALGLAYLHVVEPGISGALSTGEDRSGQLDAAWARERWDGRLVSTGECDRERALAALCSGDADAIGFARLFLANPDLPERLAAGAALNAPDRETFYGGDDVGYLDYPSLEAERCLAELRGRVALEGEGPLAEAEVEPLSSTTDLDRWALAWAADRLRADLLAADAA